MLNPAGKSSSDVLRGDFDRRLMLQFRGLGGHFGCRIARLSRTRRRTGPRRNGGREARRRPHRQERPACLVGLIRQSVFGRLAGYEDVNDAERLRHDPAMRWIIGGKAAERQRCVTEPDGPFRDALVGAVENLAALTDLSGHWIDRVA